MVRDGIHALLEVAGAPREHNFEDLEASMVKMTIGDVVSQMQPIMKNELKMTAEAVILRHSNKANCFFVECGQLCDYMQMNGKRDFREAIQDICDVNEGSGATPDNTAILIDEKAAENITEDCKDCAKTNNKKLKERKLKEAMTLESALKIIGESGIKCVLNPISEIGDTERGREAMTAAGKRRRMIGMQQNAKAKYTDDLDKKKELRNNANKNLEKSSKIFAKTERKYIEARKNKTKTESGSIFDSVSF